MGGLACPGDQLTFTCVANSFLRWMDKDDNRLAMAYTASSSIGTTQSENNINFNLTNTSMDVLTSTATTTATENCMTLQCTDTLGSTEVITVDTRSSRFCVISTCSL